MEFKTSFAYNKTMLFISFTFFIIFYFFVLALICTAWTINNSAMQQYNISLLFILFSPHFWTLNDGEYDGSSCKGDPRRLIVCWMLVNVLIQRWRYVIKTRKCKYDMRYGKRQIYNILDSSSNGYYRYYYYYCGKSCVNWFKKYQWNAEPVFKWY